MSLISRYVSHSPLSSQKTHTQHMMYQKLTMQHSSPVYKTLSTHSLPTGWKREEVIRKIGLSTGKSVVFYISPSGQKVTSPGQLQNSLGERFNVNFFDWRTGRFIKDELVENSAKNHRSNIDFSIYNRRVASPSITQPTLISMHTDSKSSGRNLTQLKCPKQIFSERRLANVQALDHRTKEPMVPTSLPSELQASCAPGYSDSQLLQNVILSLAEASEPIVGQDQPTSVIEKNPCATLNFSQPFIKTFSISDEDIKRRELHVKQLRRKLELERRRFEA